jgi:hypothetical protein
MDTLAVIARHRRVMATIADMIVAAAAGGRVRVVVDGGYPDTVTFADHLTQALHARGSHCRCLPPRPDANPTGDRTGRPGGDSGSAAVIIDGSSGLHGTDPCHIHIRVLGPARQPGSYVTTGVAGLDHDDGDVPDEERRPDVVVDYLDPEGPIIRHIVAPQVGHDPR